MKPLIIILIVADAWRFDAFHDHMPDLKAWADTSAMSYTEAFAPSSWTVESMASLFTGQIPSHHRCTLGSPLGSSSLTLPEAFKAKGYSTRAVNVMMSDPDYGFDQGFDVYVNLLWDQAARADDDLPVDVIMETAQDNEFIFVGLRGLHEPYRSYYAGAGNTERAIMRLVERFAVTGNVVVITSDHGEHLTEPIWHGYDLSDDLTHVPLLIYNGTDSREVPYMVGTIQLFDWLVDGDYETDLSWSPVISEVDFRTHPNAGMRRWLVSVRSTTWNVQVNRLKNTTTLTGASIMGDAPDKDEIERLKSLGYVK